jgi:hypothetical protein
MTELGFGCVRKIRRRGGFVGQKERSLRRKSFDDQEVGNNELNNNSCIEMETIGIAFECFASRAGD